MHHFLISYDLDVPGQKYQDLRNAIANLGEFAHVQDSVYMVETSLDAKEIKQLLVKIIDKNDRLLIIGITSPFEPANLQGLTEDRVRGWLSRP
jgi:CRISPR-associated endonuclease Cas2